MDKYQNESHIFTKITGLPVLEISYIDKGISNNNYKIVTNNDCYVLRIPKSNTTFDRKNEQKVLKIIKDKNIDVETIYFDIKTGIKITKYIQEVDKPLNIEQFVDKLLVLHQSNKKGIAKFDVFKMLNIYKSNCKDYSFIKEEELVNYIHKIYSKYPLVVCHNDLLLANIINTENNLYIIDYEYAGLNIALFDLVSLINENNIHDEAIIKKLLQVYYGNSLNIDIINDFNYLNLFLDLLWGYWAYSNYLLTNDSVFLSIANLKKERYLLTISRLL